MQWRSSAEKPVQPWRFRNLAWRRPDSMAASSQVPILLHCLTPSSRVRESPPRPGPELIFAPHRSYWPLRHTDPQLREMQSTAATRKARCQTTALPPRSTLVPARIRGRRRCCVRRHCRELRSAGRCRSVPKRSCAISPVTTFEAERWWTASVGSAQFGHHFALGSVVQTCCGSGSRRHESQLRSQVPVRVGDDAGIPSRHSRDGGRVQGRRGFENRTGGIDPRDLFRNSRQIS